MEGRQACLYILLAVILIFLFMSFVSKGASWDQVPHKNYMLDNYPEAFPGEEGLIVVDVFLFIAYIVVIVFACRPNPTALKILMLFLVIMLFIRFILSMLFLAGDSNGIRRLINACEDEPIVSIICESDYYKTLKAAWAIEVVEVMVLNVCCGVTIFFLYKLAFVGGQ